MLDDDGRDYVDIADCAKRMNISEKQVRALVCRRVLRAVSYGLRVEPAIISGAVKP
ncbi:MAG: hypothetical protein PGN27_25090 [Mycolicibacterium neoaurum]|uniref:hypothetical protein n=1 Tax=Mycolicibacterium neoaurum TaxID=1795 RepID=UPI002FF7B83E